MNANSGICAILKVVIIGLGLKDLPCLRQTVP